MTFKLEKISQINLPKGNILKLVKSNKNHSSFEMYISMINKNQIKAWKKHNLNKSEIFVIYGKVKFVFFNSKINKFESIILNDKLLNKIIIPKKTWYGFQNIFHTQSKILSFTFPRYNEKSVERKNIRDFSYDWR